MPWEPDAQTIAASDAIRSRHYDGGGPWSPENCRAQLEPHAARLRQLIRREFPRVHISTETGRCTPWQRHDSQGRPLGEPVNNLHSVGRALDCMVDEISGSTGAALANWLVQHADEYGIQLVIWDDVQWQPTDRPSRRFTPYGSAEARASHSNNTSQHRDHVHVEVTINPAAALLDADPEPVTPSQRPQTAAPLQPENAPPGGGTFSPDEPEFLRYQSNPRQTDPQDEDTTAVPTRSGGAGIVMLVLLLAVSMNAAKRKRT